ncbi:phosphoglycerate mutase family protein [Rutstroemia sp. NJR-2017a BVV2]|nr:phosphoglycerate mutase family protein [Rutstroemia sp. NJR-2017a BVV2]
MEFVPATEESKDEPPIPLTASKLLAERIPDLLTTGKSTKSSTLHKNVKYVGPLVHWKNFEKEVTDHYIAAFPKDKKERVLDWKPADNEDVGREKKLKNHCYNEEIIVGDEHSLQARFTDQALHQVTCVAQDFNLNMRYGDSKTADCEKAAALPGGKERERLPDFAGSKLGWKINEDTGKNDLIVRPRVLGEGKVFWTHDLAIWADVTREPEGPKSKLRELLGKMNPPDCQIAEYMRLNRMKYGFVTVYKETVFLKQVKEENVEGVDPKDLKKKKKAYVLYYSNPIHHKTKWEGVPILPRGASYEGRVSVRQCMWFVSDKGFGLENSGAPMDAEDENNLWIEVKPPKPKKNTGSKGATDAGPSNAGPSNAGPSNAGPSNAGPSGEPTDAKDAAPGHDRGRSASRGPQDRQGRPQSRDQSVNRRPTDHQGHSKSQDRSASRGHEDRTGRPASQEHSVHRGPEDRHGRPGSRDQSVTRDQPVTRGHTEPKGLERRDHPASRRSTDSTNRDSQDVPPNRNPQDSRNRQAGRGRDSRDQGDGKPNDKAINTITDGKKPSTSSNLKLKSAETLHAQISSDGKYWIVPALKRQFQCSKVEVVEGKKGGKGSYFKDGNTKIYVN